MPLGLGQLLVWEWQSESYVLKQQGHFNSMVSLAYSPDGQYIVTGGDDGKVGWSAGREHGPVGGAVGSCPCPQAGMWVTEALGQAPASGFSSGLAGPLASSGLRKRHL